MRWLALGLVVVSATGCAAHTGLAPVGLGRTIPNAGFGGPIVSAFGTHIPLPYMTAGFDHGLGSRVNFSGDLHILPLAYEIAGLDAGLTWFPLLAAANRPTVGLQERLFAFASFRGGVSRRLFGFPVTSFSAAWPRSGWYFGSDLAGPLDDGDYDAASPRWLFSPFIGRRWTIGGFYLLTEVKWQGANVRSDQLAVEYLPIGGHGGLTPLFALQKRF
jgi:hypothetical protein